MTTTTTDLVPGVTWTANGQATLSGPALDLADGLDGAFTGIGRTFAAIEYRFPPLIPLHDLQRIDYLRSFPHLATFPVSLDPDEETLASFVDAGGVDGSGALRLTRPAPIRDVLTPAACYHFYAHLSGRRLDGPLYLTTRSTCFRREERYEPLRRQWSFSMREIVCIGTRTDVLAFLKAARPMAEALALSLGLDVAWEAATDPFFRPARNAKYLLQRLDPVKHELVFDGRLAIASVNLHHDHFGEAFDISSEDGTAATSGCLAFGVERWISAVTDTHGVDPASWPEEVRGR